MSNQGEVRLSVPDIEQLFSALLENENQGNRSSKRASPLIQRVPRLVIDIKEDFKKYFEPRLVALGPLHHGNPKFERAELSKLRLAALFVRENETTYHALINKIKEAIEDLKKCYKPEDIKGYDDEKLAWMFFVDGCAVLYSVHYGLHGDFTKLNINVHLLVFAQIDLFLLENQIPYRVLKILIGSAKDPRKWQQSITKFIDINLTTNIGQKRPDAEDQEDGEDYAHLLELLRTRHLTGKVKWPSSGSSPIGKMLLFCGYNQNHKKTFHGMKQLKECGIFVKPSETTNLKNASFYCNILGTLTMPGLVVDDSTASKFMNLVALEMCPDFDNNYEIMSYLCFVNSLIDTAEDVKELRVTGVLHNYLGSDEEVADLFRKMSRDLVPDQEIYCEVFEDIHNYCNNPLTTVVAQAYYTYFSSPWTFIVFLGSITGLLFTATQAYLALLRYETSYQTP